MHDILSGTGRFVNRNFGTRHGVSPSWSGYMVVHLFHDNRCPSPKKDTQKKAIKSGLRHSAINCRGLRN